MELDDLVCLMAASLLIPDCYANECDNVSNNQIRKALTLAEKIWETRFDMKRERREKQT
jgi:hypothetical protein